MAAPTLSFRTFLVVWAGQLVSLIGSGLTGFALAVWVYQETGSATKLSFVLMATMLPQLIVSPFAGALVDRWDRRWAMILSDAGAAVGTLVIAVLLLTDSLQLWHLYVALGFSSVFGAFQWPAYSAATTLLVSKAQYGRAAGMVQLAEAIGQVVSPVLAGLLLVTLGLGGVILIDVITFLFAVITLLVVRFPRPERSEAGTAGSGSLWAEARFGLRYILDRPGLRALLTYFSTINLLFGFVSVLFFPLVLSFASETAVGAAFSLGAIGMVVGSLLMSAWGGPKRRINGVLWFHLLVVAGVTIGGFRPSLALISVSVFIVFFGIPIGGGSSQAIWQAKVEPDVQGRVFAVRRVFAQAAIPIAYVLAGPLADNVFEPLLAEGGGLADSVGRLIGTGPGRGVAFMFILVGVLGIFATFVAWAYRPLRNLEDDIPDAVPDAAPAPDEDAVPEALEPRPAEA
jgi:MFS family permease